MWEDQKTLSKKYLKDWVAAGKSALTEGKMIVLIRREARSPFSTPDARP
jgi:hypothetical protein